MILPSVDQIVSTAKALGCPVSIHFVVRLCGATPKPLKMPPKWYSSYQDPGVYLWIPLLTYGFFTFSHRRVPVKGAAVFAFLKDTATTGVTPPAKQATPNWSPRPK